MAVPALKQLTPVLLVEAVEPSLEFWAGRLGFTQGPSVPGPDGKLQFVILERGGIEVMIQTRASAAADLPAVGAACTGQTAVLFITVEDIDAVEMALDPASIVKPRHKTFYGATEIYIREPGGTLVGFAQFGEG